MQRFGLRIGNRRSDAAADHANTLCVRVNMRGYAERADKVQNTIALLQRIEQLCRSAYNLINDRHRPGLAVIIRDGQRHALALLIDAENDELARLRFFGDVRRLHLHQSHAVIEGAFSYDFVHSFTPASRTTRMRVLFLKFVN